MYYLPLIELFINPLVYTRKGQPYLHRQLYHCEAQFIVFTTLLYTCSNFCCRLKRWPSLLYHGYNWPNSNGTNSWWIQKRLLWEKKRPRPTDVERETKFILWKQPKERVEYSSGRYLHQKLLLGFINVPLELTISLVPWLPVNFKNYIVLFF